jgi:2-keto-4-pentenoate hydratase/2-oxohepta-3-ene-1,7-dioic acid hydratase in catechol pathway
MRLFRDRELGWVVETDGGLFGLESPWIHLMEGEPVLGDPIERAPQFEAPVDPSKIVCVGLNYEHHAREMGKTIPPEPLLFMKPTTAISPPGGTIRLPPQSELVHHEGELAIVIGRRLSGATEEQAARGIFGYTCANDVTARDIQRREKRYTRAKGYDTFCPLGPAVVLARDFVPAEHRLEVRVNGEVRQQSGLDDFIFDIPFVVSFISQVMTLLPGDVILTGTPAGVGPLVAGDRVEVEIEPIGTLTSVAV